VAGSEALEGFDDRKFVHSGSRHLIEEGLFKRAVPITPSQGHSTTI